MILSVDSGEGADLSEYARALSLLEEAMELMESLGDTLIAAHLTTPLDLIQDRLSSVEDPTRP